MTAQTIKVLQGEIEALQQAQRLQAEELQWMKALIRAVGIEGPWVTPQVAATALGRSRDRIIADIQTAEEWRTVRGKTWDLKYGTHYRNDQSPASQQPAWKVHLTEYQRFLSIPPDQLKA